MSVVLDRSDEHEGAISLGPRLARSARFDELFTAGMRLVEDAASYLDGPGRLEAQTLQSPLAEAYSAEGMRLTSRLMQLAAWLLLRRALERGEVSADEALENRVSVSAQGGTTPRPLFLQLPLPLQRLTERSLRLQRRVIHLDRMMAVTAAEPAADLPHGLAGQHARLQAAFGAPL